MYRTLPSSLRRASSVQPSLIRFRPSAAKHCRFGRTDRLGVPSAIFREDLWTHPGRHLRAVGHSGALADAREDCRAPDGGRNGSLQQGGVAKDDCPRSRDYYAGGCGSRFRNDGIDVAGWSCGCLARPAERPDYTTVLATVTVPTLIIVGDRDEYTPVADARFLQEHIHGSQLVVIADASSSPNLEHGKNESAGKRISSKEKTSLRGMLYTPNRPQRKQLDEAQT